MNQVLAVCDDELLAAEKTVQFLRELEAETGDNYRIHIYQSGKSLLEDIKEKLQIDTLLLDIELNEYVGNQERNGIDVAKAVNRQLPKCNIVYLTNYIQYAERHNKITYIHTTEQEYITKLKMDEIENLLGKKQFARCHNSFIVGLRYVDSYKRDVLIVAKMVRVPISRRYQSEVRNRFMKWSREHVF